jgi:hypothetical protein
MMENQLQIMAALSLLLDPNHRSPLANTIAERYTCTALTKQISITMDALSRRGK